MMNRILGTGSVEFAEPTCQWVIIWDLHSAKSSVKHIQRFNLRYNKYFPKFSYMTA